MAETNTIYCVLEYVSINVLSPTDVEGMRPMLPLSHDSVEAPIRQVSAEEMYSAAAAPPRAARPVTSCNSTLRYASTDDFYTDLPHEGGLFRRSSSRRAARDDEW